MEAVLLLFVLFCAFVVIVIVCESLVLGCWRGGADGIVPAGGEPGRAPARQSRTKIDREVPPLFLIPPSPPLGFDGNALQEAAL